MSSAPAIWRDVAAGASVVLLLALAGALLSLALLWRMRRDYLVAEAAERLEAVDLSGVIIRYVPVGLRSQKADEEIPLVKQAISARRIHWKRLALCFSLLALCAAGATGYAVRRHPQLIAFLNLPSREGRSRVDPLQVIPGVWGWRADYQQSCEQNPQTISVSPDGKTLSVDYAKRYWPQLHFEYAVVSAQSNTLVLKSLNYPASNPSPPTVTIDFQDDNTFLMTRSDQPAAILGAIERCKK